MRHFYQTLPNMDIFDQKPFLHTIELARSLNSESTAYNASLAYNSSVTSYGGLYGNENIAPLILVEDNKSDMRSIEDFKP